MSGSRAICHVHSFRSRLYVPIAEGIPMDLGVPREIVGVGDRDLRLWVVERNGQGITWMLFMVFSDPLSEVGIFFYIFDDLSLEDNLRSR